MALVECPECGNQVSDRAKACPRCGFPIESDFEKASIRYCTSCGSKLNPEALTCEVCGAPAKNAVEAPLEPQESHFTTSVSQRRSEANHLPGTEPPTERAFSNQTQTMPRCPICGSTALSAGKKGGGIGKAAAGAIIAGPIGLLAGGIGMNKLVITCLNCGHTFEPSEKK